VFVKKNQAWGRGKDLRIIVLGCCCEVCGEELEPEEIIGHHVKGRKKGKKICQDICTGGLRHWSSRQNRCTPCEIRMHENFKDGNSEETMQIQINNNQLIRDWLDQATPEKYPLMVIESSQPLSVF
jgi:hypothetical protein